MTKKKRGHPTADEVLARPWCYYCERDFDDLKILISHQKAKHFKCEKCGRRLNTAGGLSVHMTQVHKENLEAVENALPNRSGLNVEIFGMEGIPEDIVQQHNQRVLTQFHQAEEERRAATGNPPPGSGEGGASKKVKLEESGDLKARLAAFKAKKAAAASGVSSGSATPTGAAQVSQPPDTVQSPNAYQSFQYPGQGSPAPPTLQQPYGSSGYGQQQPYPQSLSPLNQGPGGFAPPPQQMPPGMPGYQPYPQAQQYATGSSPQGGMFQQNYPHAGSPAQNGSVARPPGLPSAPGLPQRPAFGAPQATAEQLQQMHQGQYPMQAADQQPPAQDPRLGPAFSGTPNNTSANVPRTVTEADVDNLIANATKQPDTNVQSEGAAQADAPTEKKSKKDKDRATKMMYENNEISPEEKMAQISRYAFDPSDPRPDTVLGEAVEATVTNPVDDGFQED